MAEFIRVRGGTIPSSQEEAEGGVVSLFDRSNLLETRQRASVIITTTDDCVGLINDGVMDASDFNSVVMIGQNSDLSLNNPNTELLKLFDQKYKEIGIEENQKAQIFSLTLVNQNTVESFYDESNQPAQDQITYYEQNWSQVLILENRDKKEQRE